MQLYRPQVLLRPEGEKGDFLFMDCELKYIATAVKNKVYLNKTIPEAILEIMNKLVYE